MAYVTDGFSLKGFFNNFSIIFKNPSIKTHTYWKQEKVKYYTNINIVVDPRMR